MCDCIKKSHYQIFPTGVQVYQKCSLFCKHRSQLISYQTHFFLQECAVMMKAFPWKGRLSSVLRPGVCKSWATKFCMVGPQYGTWYMSPLRHLEFWDGFLILWKFVDPWHKFSEVWNCWLKLCCRMSMMIFSLWIYLQSIHVPLSLKWRNWIYTCFKALVQNIGVKISGFVDLIFRCVIYMCHLHIYTKKLVHFICHGILSKYFSCCRLLFLETKNLPGAVFW